MTRLDIESSYVARDVLRLAVSGDVDMASTDTLAHAFDRALALDGIALVLVDLQSTTFLDSAGIRSMLLARQTASENGITFRITNASPIARRVLQLTGVFDLLAHGTDTAEDSATYKDQDPPARDLPTES
jgi:anti-sigma B factor antagonist